jgi:hypothetical protein
MSMNMETNNVIEYRPTAKFLNVRVSMIGYFLVIVISSVHRFREHDLSDWQPWCSLIVLLSAVYLLKQPQKQIRMRISPEGIEFTQPQSGLLSPLNDIPQHEIAKIQWIVGSPKGRWSLQRTSYVLLVSRMDNKYGYPRRQHIQDAQWQSDSGQSPSSVLAEYFPERVEKIQQNNHWRLSSPVVDPHALDLGSMAEYCMWSCLACCIVGFLLFFLNPYESLTWGDYQTVVWYLAAIIGSITALLFIFSKIKLLAKIINILMIVPLFSAAVTLLVHGFLMIGNDVFAPSTHTTFELVKQHDDRDTWRSAHGWTMHCTLTQHRVSEQKIANVKHGWFDLVRINRKRFCTL